MIVKVTETTRKNIRILAAWNGVSDIVNNIIGQEEKHLIDDIGSFIKFATSLFYSANSDAESKRIMRAFSLVYHSDKSNEFVNSNEKFIQMMKIYENSIRNLQNLKSKTTKNQNNSTSYNSNKEFTLNMQYVAEFIREVQNGIKDLNDISYELLKNIAKNPSWSLAFCERLINSHLITDTNKIYANILNSIASDINKVHDFIDFLRTRNLNIPRVIERAYDVYHYNM